MRLLIVDDGHYVVIYLKHLLDWKKYGIEHIETTTNSIEAKQRLKQNDIDILITDIRMPEVSGIDLLQHIDEEKLKTKVIFLSGYSEFDYAQQALRLGALDYLLKPVDKDDMEKAMRKAVHSLDKHKSKITVAGEKLDSLGYLLSIIGDSGMTWKDYAAHEAAFMHEKFCFFVVRKAREKDEMILRDSCEGLKTAIWTINSTMVGFIAHNAATELANSMEHIVFSEEFEFAQRNTVTHYFYRFFFNENVSVSDLAMLRERACFPDLASEEWELSKKNILKKYAGLQSTKQKIIYLLELTHLLYFTSVKLQPATAVTWIFDQLRDPDTALQTMISDVTQLERSFRSSNSDIVKIVQAYIADHLGHSLCLEDLGKLVHLHPVYLSKLYKQETGENLSNYIAMKRLEKAYMLLVETDLHVVDISHLVGYKKPQYFIKLFKDQYGITPYQYRRKK